MAISDSTPATSRDDVDSPTLSAISPTLLSDEPQTAEPPESRATDAASEQTVISGAGTHDPNVTLVADSDARQAQKGTQTFQVHVNPERAFASDERTSDQARYELGEDFARGGLGKLRKAIDKRIQREVAFKELLPKGLSDPALVERFLEEAQITGQLEHPGIVPIYDLGWQDNGTPFYAMKFVRGETFRTAIEALHTLPLESAERKLRFAKHLRAFIDVCQAIAFAHHRGVLHRDLKPHNVMLGEFGETLVLDWGLAKVYSREAFEADEAVESVSAEAGTNASPSAPTSGQKSDADEATLLQKPVQAEATLVEGMAVGSHNSKSPLTEFMGRSGTGSETAAISGTATPSKHGKTRPLKQSVATNVRTDASKTQVGSIMGTPSYMPPEQARGQSNLDERTDVYSLGAILYELLTGKAPITKGPEMLKRILESRVPLPRSINRAIPPALEAIAMKALSNRPEDRYATALDLAADVERYLADEPTSVYREPWQTRLRRWARKNRTLVTSTAVAVVLVGGGWAAWRGYESQRVAGLQNQVRTELDLAQEALTQNDLATAKSSVDNAHAIVRAEPGLGEFSSEIELTRASIARREFEEEDKRITQLRQDVEKTIEAARVDAETRNDLTAAIAKLTQAETRLVNEDRLNDLWRTAKSRLEGLKRQQARLDAEGAEARRYAQFELLLEEARFLTANMGEVGRRPASDAAHKARLLYDVKRGSPLQVPDALAEDKARQLGGQVQELLLLSAVGALSVTGEKRLDAVREAHEYLEHLSELTTELQRPRSEVAGLLMVTVLNELDRKAEADALRQEIGTLEASSAADWVIIGQQVQNSGQYSQAFFYYEQALKAEPDHFLALYSQGACNLQLLAALSEAGDQDTEVTGYLKAASTAFTGCLALRPDFPWSYMMRAVATHSLGAEHVPEAHVDFERALQLANSPSVFDENAFRFALHMNRGAAYFKEGRLDKAEREFQDASRIPPGDSAAPLIGQAQVFARQEKFTEALDQLAMAIIREPAKANAHRLMADVLVSLNARYPGRYPAELALEALDKALEREVSPVLQASDLYDVGRIHFRAGRYTEALAAFDESLEISSNAADVHRLRGEALLALEKLPEAIEALSEYLERARQPKADAYRARGLAYDKLGKFREATLDYTRSLELEPNSPHIQTELGWKYLLRNYRLAEEAFDTAIAEAQAIDRNAENGHSWNGRGFARVKLGRHAEGTADADEAVTRGPKAFQTYFNAACTFAQAIPALNRDGTLSEMERQTLRDRYLARAVELLKEAGRRAPSPEFFGANLDGDEALDPLRENQKFKDLK